ncbi:SNF2-related protein [Chryseobacterium sp.]|uniref:DEAD/DEAH box helicase n=1 Tax=Chryseobacterium sp. TaxID=1871047 RepID=UPI00289ABB8A|nr:SNF2-related protein [Chryseobacterium sp.]
MINVLIDIINDADLPHFKIEGDTELLSKNKRLILSLKRLKYFIKDNAFFIPFREENQIAILQELKDIFTKFGIQQDLSESATDEVSNYEREIKLFEIFSEKARSIRNNEFDNCPDLIQDFDQFQSIVGSELKRTLYDLQLLSSFHLAFSQNACNFAVPGAGKTSIVYGAYAYLKNLPHDHPKRVDKLMVIGPLSSFAPWENEYIDCFGRTTTFQRLSGDINISKKEKVEHLYSANPCEVTLIYHGGVTSLQKEITDFLKNNKTMIVVDEAHRIKNHEGVWGTSVTEVSKEAAARVILTGTPIPNGYQDIFNLYKFLYPFKYKEILQFHYQNLVDLTRNASPDSERVQHLKDNISPFFIRIKKDDLKLPPVKESVINIPMDDIQREIYDFIENKYIDEFRKNPSADVKDILNRAKLIRLRQASTNPSLLSKTLKDSLQIGEEKWDTDPNYKFLEYSEEFLDDSDFFNKILKYAELQTPNKFIAILDIIKEKILPAKGKVIIWTIFIQNAKELQKYLENNCINSNLLIGEISQVEREITISKFNDPNNSEFSVVIANPFSVAESISLHKGCHNAIYLERDYNASNFIQSKDRIHRVGLAENIETNYYYVVSEDSIDEIINYRLRQKVERMEQIINDDIPLFSRVNDTDETDLIKDLIASYAKRS